MATLDVDVALDKCRRLVMNMQECMNHGVSCEKHLTDLGCELQEAFGGLDKLITGRGCLPSCWSERRLAGYLFDRKMLQMCEAETAFSCGKEWALSMIVPNMEKLRCGRSHENINAAIFQIIAKLL